jgi:hypothetical protein
MELLEKYIWRFQKTSSNKTICFVLEKNKHSIIIFSNLCENSEEAFAEAKNKIKKIDKCN